MIFDFNFGYRRPAPVVYEVVEPVVIVEERPVVVAYDEFASQEIGRVESPRNSNDELLEVWHNDESYLLDDGEYFKRGSEGLVWIPTPVGAVVPTLPIGVNTVWHEEREFLEFDGGYFRRSPAGFKVVNPPWAVAQREAAPGNEMGTAD